MSNLIYGFDIGISSTGTAIFDDEKNEFVELSVRRFEQAKEAKTRRLAKSAARTTARKKWRKDQLLALFNDYGLISKEEIGTGDKRNNYLSFYGKGEGLEVPNVYTVYHLRKKALTERVSKRELLLCLYNILQARGHFLLESIDFNRGGITFELFKDKFYELTEKYIVFVYDKVPFEKEVLEPLFKRTKSGKDLEKQIKNSRYIKDDEENTEADLIAICKIISGFKAKIGKFYGNDEETSKNIDDLKKSDELNEFQEFIVELYDLCRIAKILKDGCNYVCDIAVESIDQFAELKNKNAEESRFDKWKSISKKRIRSYKNLGNNYPNGLYIKEVDAILENQKQYYSEISPDFIEICKSIISSKIPYYVGPLGEKARNGWAIKDDNFKYSYDYSVGNLKCSGLNCINQFNTIKKWKENMVSHCTYLPEEIAMPKGSLIGEVFSIVNEMNNLQYIDCNGELYQLTEKDKIRIIDELFLKKSSVTFNDVKSLLNLYRCETKKGSSSKFNNRISIYQTISALCGKEYQLNSIEDLFIDKDKVNRIEELILNINLFDQGKLKEDYFINEMKFPIEVAKKLSSINVKGFYSISRKFVFEIPMNSQGDSMLDILFEDNEESFVNNQQVIISNACDKDGNKIDFLADKYEKILRENDNKLSIDLLIDKGKPLMPISRPVVRALNEAFKVYNACLEIYGVPKRVIVETANGDDSIKDFTEQNGSPMKHFDQMPKLIEYLDNEIKDVGSKKHLAFERNAIDWEEIKAYYASNRKKIELYIRQNGIDLLTGKKIDVHHLEDYEIDHILPRGFGNDSQDDKMLTSKLANGKKGDRLPIEFLESEDAIGFTEMTVGRYVNIVNSLADIKAISSKKKEILLMKDQSEAEIFINQNIVDTRYIISQFVSMLNAFNKANSYNTHIVCMNGSFTSAYRKYLNLRKDRDLGDQHHAYDAAMLCIADKCLNCYFPNYDRRPDARRTKGNAPFNTYSEFVKEIKSKPGDADEDKLKTFIYYVFRKAFNQDIYKLHTEAPLLTQLKSITPLISWKVEKNYDGQYFNANLETPKKEKADSIMKILGLSNNRRTFIKLNTVAVDFYKIKHKHYAIHIPLVIIDKDGSINKEKYIKLVREHYKANELIDENGELNLKAYKFRAFRKDIVYDTNVCEPYLFSMGSMVKKTLELNRLNVFSYRDIMESAKEIRELLSSHFNVKYRSNQNGFDFSSINKEDMVEYLCCDEIGFIHKDDKEKIARAIKEINNIYDCCNRIAYCSKNLELKYPSDGENRIRPIANHGLIKANPDAEYVKLKYNELGVRFSYNEKGTLIISGPNGYKNGGFKRIKKEEFSWKISKM